MKGLLGRGRGFPTLSSAILISECIPQNLKFIFSYQPLQLSRSLQKKNLHRIRKNTMHLALILAAVVAGCSTDMDCQLNGVCNVSSGMCTCTKAWKGDRCELLDTRITHDVYREKTTSSWGGNALNISGSYHMWVSEFGGCGMDLWRNASRIVHLVAPHPTGPFSYVNTAVPQWAHNPQVIMLSPEPNLKLLMFHIGGTKVSTEIPDCSANGNGTTPEAARLKEKQAEAPPEGFTTGPMFHLASSVDGPWTAAGEEIIQCANPAPTLLQNGSVAVWCAPCGGCHGSCSCSGEICECASGDFSIFIASSWGEPFVRINATVEVPASLYDETFKLDDPVMWTDANNNFHIIHHNGDGPAPCGLDTEVGKSYRDGDDVMVGCGAHLYSKDGVRWVFSDRAAYNASVTTAAGYATHLYRQRPKLLLGADRVPTHLFTGEMQYPKWGEANIIGPRNHDYSWTAVTEIGG